MQKYETDESDGEVTEQFFYPYKRLTDEFTTAKKKELSKLNGQVFSAVVSLFSVLEQAFDLNYAALRAAAQQSAAADGFSPPQRENLSLATG